MTLPAQIEHSYGDDLSNKKQYKSRQPLAKRTIDASSLSNKGAVTRDFVTLRGHKSFNMLSRQKASMVNSSAFLTQSPAKLGGKKMQLGARSESITIQNSSKFDRKSLIEKARENVLNNRTSIATSSVMESSKSSLDDSIEVHDSLPYGQTSILSKGRRNGNFKPPSKQQHYLKKANI